MARRARDDFTGRDENVASRQTKLAEVERAQAKNLERAEQSNQGSTLGLSSESPKPARRKGNTSATKKRQQAPKTLDPADKSKANVSGPADQLTTAVPQTTTA